MRLSKSQIQRIASLLENSDAHSVKVEQLREVTNATCAVRVSFVGSTENPPVDVSIVGSVRLSRDEGAPLSGEPFPAQLDEWEELLSGPADGSALTTRSISSGDSQPTRRRPGEDDD